MYKTTIIKSPKSYYEYSKTLSKILVVIINTLRSMINYIMINYMPQTPLHKVMFTDLSFQKVHGMELNNMYKC